MSSICRMEKNKSYIFFGKTIFQMYINSILSYSKKSKFFFLAGFISNQTMIKIFVSGL